MNPLFFASSSIGLKMSKHRSTLGLFHDFPTCSTTRFPKSDGKMYWVGITENPGETLKQNPIQKSGIVQKLHRLTDVAMNTSANGHSFGEKKVASFIPDNGWMADVWDPATNQLVGFSSVSRKTFLMTMEDVEFVIDQHGDDEEKYLFSNDLLLSQRFKKMLNNKLRFACHVIESSMIHPDYQGLYLSTSAVEAIFAQALLRNQTAPINDRLNYRLKKEKGCRHEIDIRPDELFVATIAATIRTCAAMKPFADLYPNPCCENGIDWFEKTKRYIVAGRQSLISGFILKDRYPPGLNYPLDENGEPVVPIKEKESENGRVWHGFLLKHDYSPLRDATLLTGWISFSVKNSTAKYVLRKLRNRKFLCGLMFVRNLFGLWARQLELKWRTFVR